MLKQIPPITKNLLIINCIIFLAQQVMRQRGIDLADIFGLHFVLAGNFHWWQTLTYMFLHSNFAHLFFNMFSLWMFGRIVEQTMSQRRYLIYILTCGIGAAFCQELWQVGQYLVDGLYRYDSVRDLTGYTLSMGAYLDTWTTIGASGVCYGILLAFGMAFPNERILLLFPPIPIKAKYFVIGYAVIELATAFTSDSNIAHFAHVGGMLFGWLLLLWWRRSDRGDRHKFNGWETWTPRRSQSWWERLRDRWLRFTTRRKAGLHRNTDKSFKDRASDYDYNARQRANEAHIDAILDKVKRSGYQSLTEAEKKELFDNSKR